MKQINSSNHGSKKGKKTEIKQHLQQFNSTNEMRPLKLLRFIPALVWMGVIFYLSSKTGDELDSVLPFIQRYFPFIADFNWGHYVSYFVLAMTFDFAFAER